MKFKNVFKIEHIRNGEVLDSFESENLVTTQGATNILDAMFDGGTVPATWYLGLISGATPTIVAADTLASHSGWTEFTSYTGNRQVYDPDEPSIGVCVNNTNVCEFPITATGTISGAFLCSAASGTSGILFSATQYSSNYSVVNGDTYKITYTVRLVAP